MIPAKLTARAARHAAAIEQARAAGVTWREIAAVLSHGGKGGTGMSTTSALLGESPNHNHTSEPPTSP